jgi:hypothetical protein
MIQSLTKEPHSLATMSLTCENLENIYEPNYNRDKARVMVYLVRPQVSRTVSVVTEVLTMITSKSWGFFYTMEPSWNVFTIHSVNGEVK